MRCAISSVVHVQLSNNRCATFHANSHPPNTHTIRIFTKQLFFTFSCRALSDMAYHLASTSATWLVKVLLLMYHVNMSNEYHKNRSLLSKPHIGDFLDALHRAPHPPVGHHPFPPSSAPLWGFSFPRFGRPRSIGWSFSFPRFEAFSRVMRRHFIGGGGAVDLVNKCFLEPPYLDGVGCSSVDGSLA